MLKTIKKYRSSILLAVAFHVMLFSAVFINWQQTQKISKKLVIKKGDVIQVTAISVEQYQQKVQQIKDIEKRKKKKIEQQKKKKIEQLKKKKQEKNKKIAAEKKPKAEVKKKQELKRKKALIKKKVAEKKKKQLQRKQQLEKQQLKKKQQQKKAAEKKQQEIQHQKELEVKRKKADKQRKIAEKKRQETIKRRNQAEQQRQTEIAAESARMAADKIRRQKGIVNRYAVLVQNKISRYWRQPAKVTSKMKCTLNIRMTPNGEVVSVKVVKSSGNYAFDRAAEKAVTGASPLPVPTDKTLFEKNFRNLTINYEK